MPRSLVAVLACAALAMSGCAMSEAASVEPSGNPQATPVAAPQPRPTADPGLDSRGPAQVVHTVDTKDKVVFLTIDDGLDPDPALLKYLQDNNIPITVFLTTGTVADWQYWKDIQSVASIQNHSVVHPSLPRLGPAGEEKEICDANDAISEKAEQVPWMLRPPYGAYDASTLAAAGQCGLDYVVHWSVSLPGKKLEYQSVGGSLKPGDIILTHFREGLPEILPKVIDDIRAQGFELARLEDYLTPRGWATTSQAPAPADMQMETDTESRAYLTSG